MRALVVYESMFGNTEAVARAVAAGLAELIPAEVADVAGRPPLGDDLTVLALGGPTHAFGLSRPATRQSAAEQGATGPVETGLREWLAGYRTLARLPAAAFGTRADRPHLTGSAARSATRRLRRLGARIVLPGESFLVTGVAGPLRDGELDRARRWGRTLAGLVAPAQPVG